MVLYRNSVIISGSATTRNKELHMEVIGLSILTEARETFHNEI